jgi:AbrB family looped-hinge helix DNA binding protein
MRTEFPYKQGVVRTWLVDVSAKLTSKGQVTIPKAVRDALGIREGDHVVFRVVGNRAVLARTPDFLDLAGTIEMPAAKRNKPWDEVIRKTRAARVSKRR